MKLRIRRESVTLCCPVTYSSGSKIVGQGTLTNVSDRGWKVRTFKRQVPQGSYLSLHVALPGRQAAIKVDRAIVRWSREGEFGVELLRIQADHEDRLRRFLNGMHNGATRVK